MSKNLLVIVPMPEYQVQMVVDAANAAEVEVATAAPDTAPEAAAETWSYEYFPKGLAGGELAAALQRADAVIGEPDNQALVDYMATQPAGDPKLKLIQMTWAGTDKYTRSPIPFPRDIILCNAVGGFGHIISQYTLAMTLSIMQNLPGYRANQLAEDWRDLGPVQSLDDATVLIVGAGDIGGHVARRISGFDAHIVGVCQDASSPRPYFDELCTLDEAEAWLPKADVVVGAIPNSDQSAKWLNAERLAAMKEGAVLVNVGRGNFIDCMALADTLAAGHLRGAALDVTDPEPLPVGHPLWQEPRCVITPHTSGGSFGRHVGTELRITQIACDNIKALICGGAFRTPVFK